MVGKIVDPAGFFQIGIVVRSLDATVAFYREVLGLGPFTFRDVEYPTATYHGVAAGYRGRRAFCTIGTVQIELIELVDGKTIHEDFLRDRGEGLHHLGFFVDDLGEGMRRARDAGLAVTQSFQRSDGAGFAYLDTDRVGGTIIELIQKTR
jgi:catechol 2,3-dioxygenase-like lactoylglutathione lyase family enzyme